MAAAAIIDRQTFAANGVDQVEASIQDITTKSRPAASLKDTTLSQRGRHFIDDHGRVVSLRGFNVSAASKLVRAPSYLRALPSANILQSTPAADDARRPHQARR